MEPDQSFGKETTLKKKTLFTLLIVLLLFTLACSMADLSAAGAALRSAALDTPASPPPITETVAVPALVVREIKDIEALLTHRVCTGVPNGLLRVREIAGTDAAVVAVLDEGMEVSVLNEVPQEYKGTWAQIAAPAGWVNTRFLCEKRNE